MLYRSIIEAFWGPASRPWGAKGGQLGDDLEYSWGIGSTKSRSDEVGRRRNENVCYIGAISVDNLAISVDNLCANTLDNLV